MISMGDYCVMNPEDVAKAVLAAAYPDLAAGTHWIAPVKPTEAMIEAVAAAVLSTMDFDDDMLGGMTDAAEDDAQKAYAAMRNAYLKDHPEG